MGRYIVRRLAWVVLVLLVVTFLTYLIFFVAPPTDPAVNFCGRQPTQGCIVELRRQFGLDKPFYVQYGLFAKRIFLGDQYGWPGMGFSFNTRSALKPIIIDRLGVTMQLAIGAALVWLLVGIPIGILSALKPRSLADRLALGFVLFGVSAPVFWLGLVFLYVFWFKLHIAAGTGYVALGTNFFTWANHLALPWIVLALLYAAGYTRYTRANLIETMTEDYIRTARAKGLSERRVVMKHGFRGGLTPLVTIFGLDLAGLLGGAVITESVFNLQGLGRLAVQSIRSADLYAIVDVTLVAAFFVILANLVVDVLYAFLDPRVRYT
ncbi:MAG TPA: ABC transporter permease [Actinobacteria bacterium]|nr:ABC transporter permease [Actinomycetota bacterium]